MWLDHKYIGLISGRLDRFKRVNPKTYNFRCPICGDSQKHKHKARGFFFEKNDGGFLYHCHNCNITLGLDKFLERIDHRIYKEYILEKFGDRKGVNHDRKGVNHDKTDVELFADKMKKPKFIKSTALSSIKKISQLAYNHPAKLYVQNRKIPNPYHAKLFYAPKFKKWVNTIIPDQFEDIKNDEPRLIIPFLDENKNLFGFQGRSFDPKAQLRYITIMIDKSKSKVFNLDTCDRSKTHYIFEGPIDAMFVGNSMAMAGGSIDWDLVNENSVFVYDNEPRSKETVAKIHKVVDKIHKVCIWPDQIKQKDVNEMVLNNISNVTSILRDNTYHGLSAMNRLANWSKI